MAGSHFQELRALFGDQYRRLDDLVDRIAECVRALGGNPPGTLVGFLKHTRLIEHPAVRVSAWAMVDGLLEDHEILIRDLREDLVHNPELRLDIGTTEFLTAVLQEHEAAAWMLLSLDWKNTSLKSWLNEQEKVTYGRELTENDASGSDAPIFVGSCNPPGTGQNRQIQRYSLWNLNQSTASGSRPSGN